MSWSDGRELKTQNIGLPYPQHISPYGVVYNRDTKTFEPMSASVKFFDPQFGYSKETAVRVYKDLIDAFKFHRKEVAVDEGVEEDLSPETSTEQFEDFLQRAKERDVFPSWWDQVDDEGVRTFAREDQLRRLDRSYHWTDSRDRSLDSDSNVSQKTLTVAIGTLAERITWDASGTEARIKKAKARPPSQMVVVHQ
ncbi:hypothetical protein FRB99_005893 [Tulasnella sp. 403]|nr:hypothetical protein FRB99_005893 [Tulasnella sp. 403]